MQAQNSEEGFASCVKRQHNSNVTLRFVTRILISNYQHLFLCYGQSFKQFLNTLSGMLNILLLLKYID